MIGDICREIINGVRVADINCIGIDCYECPFSYSNNDDNLACDTRSGTNTIKIAKQYLNGICNDEKLNEAIKHYKKVASSVDTCKKSADKHYDLMNWLLELKQLREFKNNVMNAIYK